MKKTNSKTKISFFEKKYFDKYILSISPSVLKNCLHTFKKDIKELCEIKVALSFLTTSSIPVITVNNYKDTMGIKGVTWEALLTLIFLCSLVYTIFKGLIILIKFLNNGSMNEENFIPRLEKEKSKTVSCGKINKGRYFPRFKIIK